MTVDYVEAARATVRGYCGWVVTPPEDKTLTLTGSGDVLSLPTLHLTALVSVVEDGVSLDVASEVGFDTDTGVVWKKNGRSWSRRKRGITITFTHGYDAGAAPDFDAAVEQAGKLLADPAVRVDPTMKRNRVDDTEVEWYPGVMHSVNTSLLSRHRLLIEP